MMTGTMANLREHHPVDFTENGRCSGCGNCCSNILPMADAEVKRIAKYIREHGITEQKRLWANPEAMDMMCPFRDEAGRRCVIYEVRPEICRVYRCDNDANRIFPKKLKKVQKEADGIVLMRETFFGKKGGGEDGPSR